MGLVDGQVDDDVDRVVGEEVVERGMDPAGVLLAEGGSADGIQVRRRNQPNLRMGQDVARISAGDVAGSDDADAERLHGP